MLWTLGVDVWVLLYSYLVLVETAMSWASCKSKDSEIKGFGHALSLADVRLGNIEDKKLQKLDWGDSK